jgi:hypothetical protein
MGQSEIAESGFLSEPHETQILQVQTQVDVQISDQPTHHDVGESHRLVKHTATGKAVGT